MNNRTLCMSILMIESISFRVMVPASSAAAASSWDMPESCAPGENRSSTPAPRTGTSWTNGPSSRKSGSDSETSLHHCSSSPVSAYKDNSFILLNLKYRYLYGVSLYYQGTVSTDVLLLKFLRAREFKPKEAFAPKNPGLAQVLNSGQRDGSENRVGSFL